MFLKKLTIQSVLFNLLLVIPVFSFAAISEQDMNNFKSIYGSDIKPETSANILNYCNKNDTDLVSCLSKLQAQSSEQESAQSQASYSYCCENVSGHWGDYAYIRGQAYCVPPCG